MGSALPGGLPTTAGSRILAGFRSPYASSAQERLEAAGAILIGKTNCDEFAMGSSNENSAFGPVHNPWDETTVPGGSSGGSAAAVASGQALFALGTDTGGSIRQPASLTGTVGMKPTYGRVSRYGMVAFASSLDQCGPLAHTVRDVALVLGALAGHDPRDSTSVDTPVPDYLAALTGDVRGLRLGVPREYFVAGMEPGVEAAVRAGVETLRGLGAEIVDVSLPSTDRGLATYYIIAPAEASANLARYDGVRYGLSAGADELWDNYERTRGTGFGDEVKRRIMLGTYALSAGYYDAYYVKAQQVRTLIKAEFDEVLDRGRRHPRPDLSDRRVQDRREGRRPAGDVPERRLHAAREHRRASRHQRAVRAVGGPPGRTPGHRSSLRRGDGPPRGRCLRARGRFRRPAAGPRGRLTRR